MDSQEQEHREKPAEPKEAPPLPFDERELSATWRQLLGLEQPTVSREERSGTTGELTIEPLPNDPWSALVHAKGTEVIDLQRLHSSHEPLSEQDVEQALQVLQERSADATSQQQSNASGEESAP
jgi:hypothetical protein